MINNLYIYYFYKEFMLLRTLKSSGPSLILLISITLFSLLFESQILLLLLLLLIWKGKGALS